MTLILMTTLFYKAMILQGEIWRWSLLGQGLKSKDNVKDGGLAAGGNWIPILGP